MSNPVGRPRKVQRLKDLPKVVQQVDPESIDRENAFLLYATFCGDAERTGHALDIPAADVVKMAEAEGWNKRLGPIIELKRSSDPGDVERAINRALNFTQAHRLRMSIEKLLAYIHSLTRDELVTLLRQEIVSKTGEVRYKFDTRAITDLASALEKCHAMSYMALNDSATERTKRHEAPDASASAGQLHQQIAQAMSEARKGNTPTAQLFDAQVELSELQRDPTAPVYNPKA